MALSPADTADAVREIVSATIVIVTAAGTLITALLGLRNKATLTQIRQTVNGSHTAAVAKAEEQAASVRDLAVQVATLSAERTAAAAALGAERANAQQARLIAADAALAIADLERQLVEARQGIVLPGTPLAVKTALALAPPAAPG